MGFDGSRRGSASPPARLRGLRFAFANVGPLLGWALLNASLP